MNDEDAFEREYQGASAGLSPMFGEWRHRFHIPPVPYRDGGAKRAVFRQAVQDELPNKFFYSSEVRLGITLRMDVQTVLETSETADLDNYAKSILDALKGSRGILLDDSQVQTLAISWVDNHGAARPYFDVEISSSPDDFMLKPVQFYEMADGLWYPQGRRVWSNGGREDLSDRNHFAGLLILDVMSSVKANGRHLLRKVGMRRVQAYQEARYFSSASARGFHKSRIDAGFAMHERESWRAEFDVWKRDHADEIASIEDILVDVRQNYTQLARLRAGLSPEDGPE